MDGGRAQGGDASEQPQGDTWVRLVWSTGGSNLRAHQFLSIAAIVGPKACASPFCSGAAPGVRRDAGREKHNGARSKGQRQPQNQAALHHVDRPPAAGLNGLREDPDETYSGGSSPAPRKKTSGSPQKVCFRTKWLKCWRETSASDPRFGSHQETLTIFQGEGEWNGATTCAARGTRVRCWRAALPMVSSRFLAQR